MSRYHRVWTVYRKELVDTLRDKRTLIAMILVPIVLYPALMVVLVEALRIETGRRQAEHYTVCVPTERHRQWLQGVLDREDADYRAQEEELRQVEQETGEDMGGKATGIIARMRADQVTIVVAGPGESLWNLVSQQKVHVGVLVEPSPNPANPDDATNRVVQLIYCDTDPRSEFVFGQLTRVLGNESERIVKARLAHVPRGEALLTPLASNSISTAGPDQQFAKILAMVVPFLLVTMTVTGAMYPAIDLTAGERERGTLETLAAAPVPVSQIVTGKFGVIVTIAMLSTMLNLASMTAMVHFSGMERFASWPMQPRPRADVKSVETLIEQEEAATQPSSSSVVVPVQASAPAEVSSRPASGPSGPSQRDYLEQRRQLEQQARQRIGFLKTAAPIVLLAMVPFAVLFGGVMLAACSFARSFKEAQNYMMPVMIVAIIPAMVVSYMPTVKLEGAMLVIPVANVVVLMRELFLGRYDLAALTVTLLSTCLYALASVAVAVRVYGHEAVLFGDVGSYKTLLRRRFVKPQPYPSAALALLAVAVLFPLNFYWQSSLVDESTTSERFKLVIAGAQVLIFAMPVLLLAWYAKLNLKSTFSLGLPGSRQMLGVVLMGVSVVPVSILLQQLQRTWFPPSSVAESFLERQIELLSGGSLWAVLLAFAVVPGVCEELLFRGFLLAGLRHRRSTLTAIALVGFIFALYHVNLEKIPVVTLLGMLLAFVCLRCGSIYPAMLLHMANNGLSLWLTRQEEGGALRRFFGMVEERASSAIHFDARAAVFVLVFLIGLAIVAFGAVRPRTSSDQRSLAAG
jgi:ABC-type Na+ efflux pump permease subunit/membrane protease YdiL (CAAX protease family)